MHLISAIGRGHWVRSWWGRWVGAVGGSLINCRWLSTGYGRWHGRWVSWSVELSVTVQFYVDCGLHNLPKNWSWTRHVNGGDTDETETSASQEETETLATVVETRPRLDIGTSRDCLQTETSRPRPQPCLSLTLKRSRRCDSIMWQHDK